ncbi:hypothetical protein [Prevotella histicola]|uniref:hypothetical protein n=1 Tax=Prevotella histicola TaxID=470565 RepID=UPI0028F16E86|nr:hypothetical protein [Prevotella histicola]
MENVIMLPVRNLGNGEVLQCIPFLCTVRNNYCRGTIVHPDCGYANGYVAVQKGHPWWGKKWHEVEGLVNVHGDITYAAAWKDFPYPTINLTKVNIPEDSWVFGFDTLHDGDTLEKCNEYFCLVETFKLMRQLQNVRTK